MLFVSNPAAAELLNTSAWALYMTSLNAPLKQPPLEFDLGIYCCNIAACVYGSLGGHVPSVSRRREHDAVQAGRWVCT